MDEEFEFVFFVEALNRTRRIVFVVPHPMFVAVGIKDDRALAEFLFEAIGIEFGLALAGARIAFGAFGFDDAKRFAVVAPQYVINEAVAGVVWHPRDGIFGVGAFAGERPTGFFQEQVDKVVAGFGFGIIVLVGSGGVFGFDAGDLGAETLEFGVKTCLLGQESGEVFVAFAELGFEALELFGGLGCPRTRTTRRDRPYLKQVGVERESVGGFLAARIGASEPKAEMEQLADDGERVELADGFVAVDGLVAEFFDEARFGENGWADGLAKAGFVNERAEMFLIGEF